MRERIKDNEINKIILWYSHNLPESKNVNDELITAENTLTAVLKSYYEPAQIEVSSLEVGLEKVENWYIGLTNAILAKKEIKIENCFGFETSQGKWSTFNTSIKASIVYELFQEFGTDLFSANVRDYLGSRKSDSNINFGIKTTAENEPENFFVYNNGITALVNNFSYSKSVLVINGISIVNGAQTKGAIGSLVKKPNDDILIPIRFIKCAEEKVISNIVKNNNSQNKVNAPDFRSSDEIQKRLTAEFDEMGILGYSSRRGGATDIIKRNPNIIPSVTAGQVLAAFHKNPVIAYNEKSKIWESDSYYSKFFHENTTAKHIYFLYSLQRAVENSKFELAAKNGELTENEELLQKFFRNNGSVILFIAAVSSCIEEILMRKVSNPFRLQFKENHKLEEAILKWKPVLDVLSSFPIPLDDTLSNGIKNNEKINESLAGFKQLISVVKSVSNKTFIEFSKTVSG